ncbi:MAG: glycosyltransferase family 4 protein [Thermoprotei archaeon]
MRVLLVAARFGGVSGTGQHVAGLYKYLTRSGFTVDVATADNSPHLNVPGLKTPTFALLSALAHAGRHYDVIHAHNVPQALIFKTTRGKKVLTLHGFFAEQEAMLRGSLVGATAAALEKKALSWADSVTAVSMVVADSAKRYRPDIQYIPNAVDTEQLPKPLSPDQRMGVIYAGRLSREKGVDLIPELAKKIPDVQFSIIGDGPLFSKLANESPSNVRLYGALGHSATLELMNRSRVFLLPSRSEGLSTSLIEAMMLGLTCVATNVGGNVELLSEGRGYLADYGVTSLEAALREALLEGHDTSPSMKYARENYSWNAVVKRYVTLYEMLSSQKRSKSWTIESGPIRHTYRLLGRIHSSVY